ncbi:diguanylate cyclase [Blautia schinkii]|nr:diguanylate cyclase [Blautia schinkii]
MPYKNKMLIADKDWSVRNEVKAIFEEHFEVLEAENGLEALELLNRHHRDLACIICGTAMPVMDGFVFLREKSRSVYNNGIPAVMLIDAGDTRAAREAVALGAADFVDKPLIRDVVRLRVNNVLSNYGKGYAYNDVLQRELLDLINNRLRGGTLCVYEAAGYPIYYISESLAVCLGYESASEMISELDGRWENMFAENEMRRTEFLQAEESVKRQLEEKGEFIHEYRLRKKSGEYMWVRENGRFSYTDSEKRRWVALCIDITEIKAAEERARYNEQLASIALESTSISIWEYDYASSCIIQGQNSIKVHGFGLIVPDVPQMLVETGYVHPDQADAFLKMYEDLRSGVPKVDGIFQMKIGGGEEYRYEHIYYTNTFDKDGKPYRAIGISSDVTEQQMIVIRYQREIDFNKSLSPDIYATVRLNITRETIEDYHTDIPEKQEILENAAFSGASELLGKLQVIEDKTREYFSTLTCEGIRKLYNSGQRVVTYEFIAELRGKTSWVRFELHLTKDPHNGELLAFVYFRDIDKQHREMERLKELTKRDQMTGLYNHDATIELIRQYLSQEGKGREHALLVIDIDKFKKVNDQNGHMKGDMIIVEVARRIRSMFREDDIVGRIGGDEFMVLLKKVASKEMAEKKLHELEQAVHFMFECHDINIKVGCSVGMALYSGTGVSFEELYRQADAEMYKAKHTLSVR